MGGHNDGVIIRGKCGHAYHVDCLTNCDARDHQRCPECPERWEPSGRDIVAYRCSCGEELLSLPDDEVNLLTKKALAGHGYAYYFLGIHHCLHSIFYCEGEKSPELGVKLLERAVEKGYAPAIRMLAKTYCAGTCETEQSLENAKKLLDGVEKETDKYFTPIAAEVSLEIAKYYSDTGDRYNYIQFMKKAAAKGNAEAVGILGNLYLGSKLKSKAEIIQMFSTAAVSGDDIHRAKYRFHLATLHREEGDIDKYVENLKWASYSGHMEATYLLGAYYLVGLYGCEKDPDMALLYLDRARAWGHPVAHEVICARLTRSIHLVVYFEFPNTQSISINVDPSSSVLDVKKMIQHETGVSAYAVDLLSPDKEKEVLADGMLVENISRSEGQPLYRREAFCKASSILPGVKLFESCDGWAYTELKAVDSNQHLEEILLPLEHYMLSCTDPKCEICADGCSAYSEQAQHAAICWQRASGGCDACKRFWELAKSHALRCTDTQCRMPGCRMWQKKKEEAMRQL